MHWCAWGDDGALYCADDDGANFGGPWNFAHFLKVTGVPPHHTVEEISLFPGLKRPPDEFRKRRYVAGALAVGSRLYVAVYDYNSEGAGAKPILTDPRHVGHPSMTYNPALKRFLLLTFSDIVPHSMDTPPDTAQSQ